MRSRWFRTIVTPVVAVSLAACDSTNPPPAELVDMLLDFCSDETPSFFGYLNEGGSWTRVTPDASGTFSFQATPRLGIVIIHQVAASSSSEFIYTTTTELQDFNGAACQEQGGAKTLNGSVTAMPTGNSAMISMGGAFAYITSPTTSYQLNNLPSGPLDLVAQRESFTTSAVPDRVIILRAQNLVSGATIPPFDFGSTQASAFTQNSLAITGLSGSEDNFLVQNFSTTTTRDHSVSSTSLFTSSPQTLYHVPTTLTQSGDVHETSLYAEGSNGSAYRGETQYYRTAGNRTMALGAALNNPTITSATPSPYVRLRVTLPSQAEYNSLVSAFFEQGTVSSGRIVVVTATAGYFGGSAPAVWTIDIPDLSNVSGFPTSAMLQSGTSDWWVDAYGGPAIGFFGRPSDGTTLRFAGRTSSVAAMELYRTRGARPERRATLSARRVSGAIR